AVPCWLAEGDVEVFVSSAVLTMGAAWCRERAAAAQNSKSPLDRVIVQCVTQ
ncbi:hypothetical protein L9F63_003655, partial [Diploptera punctata]